MINLTQMERSLRWVFGELAEKTAQTTGFVQRKSKLTGIKFLLTWVMGFLQHPRASLNVLCQVAADLGVDITKQGMQQRLTPAAVALFEQVFQHSKEALRNHVLIPLSLLAQFTAIYLLDSSWIALPDSLADEFPAAGGTGPKASLKLQTIWEFLCGSLAEVERQTGRQPDQRFSGHLAYVAPGALFLNDLGYLKLTNLRKIDAGGGYFINRLDTQCGLYEPSTGQHFDLLAHLKRSKADRLELNLLVGSKVRLPCRVLAVRLPAEVVAKRRREAHQKARRKGRRLSAKKLEWLAWNVYITNVPATMLSFDQVVLVYRLRWQIELLFRLWKNEEELDRIAGRRRERVLCEIYAKLIGMVVFHYLTAPIRWAERELSPVKALQTLRRHVMTMAQAILGQADLHAELSTLVKRWTRFAVKDKRRSRRSTCQQIEDAASPYWGPTREQLPVLGPLFPKTVVAAQEVVS